MSEREIIARALCLDPDECVFGSGWTGSNGSGFECSMRAWEQKLPAAHAAITALTAGGYRILAPGELDRETLEAAAKVADMLCSPTANTIASRIRSLPVENGGGG